VRVLVAGWGSFDEVVATVGDALGAESVAGWLRELGIDHDIAWAPYLCRGVNWRDIDPADYTHLVFVSGPLAERPLLCELSEAFAGVQRWAVNVSVVDESARRLFDRVRERDAPRIARPDLAFDGPPPQSPVLAVAFAPVQAEYRARSRADRVREVIEEWLAARGLPWFELGMDLFSRPYARRPAQVEALVRRADVVVSMRLHALVLGLKHGRPVIACDPIAGGAKVSRQAAALGWPEVLAADQLTPAALDAALQRCLSGGSADAVTTARDAGRAGLLLTRSWFVEQLTR
jgi:hypothetical protein